MKDKNTKSEIEILRNVVEQMLTPIKDIPLNLIIKSAFKNEVYQYDKKKFKNLTSLLVKSMNEVKVAISNEPILSSRVNEVGNKIESTIKEILNSNGLKAELPLTQNNKHKSAGYPDLKFVYDNIDYYIECKTYNQNNIKSTLRSFYLSISKDAKVISSGYHLILAFQMKKPKRENILQQIGN